MSQHGVIQRIAATTFSMAYPDGDPSPVERPIRRAGVGITADSDRTTGRELWVYSDAINRAAKVHIV